MNTSLPAQFNIDGAIDARIYYVFKWYANGLLVDLTGWTGALYLGQNGQLIKTVPSGAVPGDVDGTVTLTIPANTLTVPGRYRYVVYLTDPSSEPMHFVNGELRLTGMFP